MPWRIKHIFNFPPEKPWAHGYVNFGFHGLSGAQYFLHYAGNLFIDDTYNHVVRMVERATGRTTIIAGRR